jgi:hypothetical protein
MGAKAAARAAMAAYQLCRQQQLQSELEREAVTWPWSPRDLEALQQQFKLSGTSVTSGHSGGKAGDSTEQKKGLGPEDIGSEGSVLHFEGFLSFWSGVRHTMTKVRGGGGKPLAVGVTAKGGKLAPDAYQQA